jgi:Tat protein translocase TatB subunit
MELKLYPSFDRFHEMFGIGLPELILIMAGALIVVGPEKLPELAKTLAKQMVELKRAANTLKNSLQEEDERPAWEKITPENPQIAEYTSTSPQAQPGDQWRAGQETQSTEQPAETAKIETIPTPPEKHDAAAG